MKHTKPIDLKYGVLIRQARIREAEKIRAAKLEYLSKVTELRARRDREIAELPEVSSVRVYREDHTVRYCTSCGGAMLTATAENAKLLARVCAVRRGMEDSEEGWQFKLAAMRNPRKKYCCYSCQVGRAERHNSFDCALQSEVEADLKGYGMKR